MANFNKVILIGRLTRDVETRAFANGGMVANFGFATSSGRQKNQQTGQYEDIPMFIDCKAFNKENYKLADIIRDYCRKGSQICIEGVLNLEQWDDKATGAKRSKHSITVSSMQLLDPKNSSGGGGGYGGGGYSAPPAGGSPGGYQAPTTYGDPHNAPISDGPEANEDIPF